MFTKIQNGKQWSSLAYQGGGRQVNQSHLMAIRELTLQGFTADLTLYLDIDPAVGLERARSRGELDRIEQSGLAFFERARATYLQLVAEHDEAVFVDASQGVEQVKETVIHHIQHFLQD